MNCTVYTKNTVTAVLTQLQTHNHVVQCLLMSPHRHVEEMTDCQAFLHTRKQHVGEMAAQLWCNM